MESAYPFRIGKKGLIHRGENTARERFVCINAAWSEE